MGVRPHAEPPGFLRDHGRVPGLRDLVGEGARLVLGAGTGRVWRGAVTLLAGGVPRPGAWRGDAGVRRMVSVAIICAPLGHAAGLMRSAARSRAEAARGLPVTSS